MVDRKRLVIAVFQDLAGDVLYFEHWVSAFLGEKYRLPGICAPENSKDIL
ncbi:MAG: hypothetical protein JRD87_04440 [Deltaproteobacteria bacterium]|jgi:hypothetical protein|nr:hypothetical protein [Deltaproteobacteria bacterium]